MSKLTRLILTTLLAVLLAVAPAPPAHASEASTAYKQAAALAKKVDRARGDDARAAAQEQLTAYVKAKTALLGSKELKKLDTAYFARMQSVGGMHTEAIATFKKALVHPGETKYLSTIHIFYVRALIAAGKSGDALEAFKKMSNMFEGDKNVKLAAMSVGLALRRDRKWADSAVAYNVALKLKEPSALKPLVNSYLLAKNKAAAIKAIEYAIEVAGEFGKDPAHDVLLAITKKHGEPLPLEFDAFAPGDAPDLEGKVVVMGFFNVSAVSLQWTFRVLNLIRNRYPPTQGVVVLGVSTYYKKNPDTGLVEEDMSKEQEQAWGLTYSEHEDYLFEGQLAYTANREQLLALGVSALPFIAIRGKDGKLLYAHTLNTKDKTELEVIGEMIGDAAAK